MSSELHISITVPDEYAHSSGDGVVLDMPITYARRLGEVLRDGCDFALAKETLAALSDTQVRGLALSLTQKEVAVP